MSILRRSMFDLQGVYNQAGATWTQPGATLVPLGSNAFTWKCKSTSTGYNGATIVATLQGTVDGDPDNLPGDSSDWVDLGVATFTADGFTFVTSDGGNFVQLQGYRYVRVFHSLTGGPPTADVTVDSRFTGDYVD